MIRKRNILKITLPRDVNVKPMNNLNPVDYEKIGRDRRKSSVEESEFRSFGHVINLTNLPVSTNIITWVSSKKICVVFHIFYEDLLGEIYERLNSLNFNFDLIIVTPHNSPLANSGVDKRFDKFNYTFLKCPNIGKDIGGKLTAFQHIIQNKLEYDYLILAHDKKSTHAQKEIGTIWRKELYDGVFSQRNVNFILNGFMTNDKIKMSGNRVREGLINSRAIAVHLGNARYINNLSTDIFKIPIQLNTAFIGGTMFWMDWKYFVKIFEAVNLGSLLKLMEEGNVKEPSYAHAMERMFGLLLTYKGYKIGSV